MSDLYFLTAGNVAGVTISVFELLQTLHEQQRLQKIIADALIQKYLVKRARQAGITVTPQDRERILAIFSQNGGAIPDQNAMDREILVAKLKERTTHEEIKKRFETDPRRFDRLHIRHIVVTDEVLMQQVMQALREERATFAELAQQYSIHEPSRHNGGDMGVSFRHQLPSRVANAVTNAANGDVIGPLKLEAAYSVLKVEQIFPAELTPQLMGMMVDELFEVWLKAQLRDEMMDFPLIARIQQETEGDGNDGSNEQIPI